MEKKRIGLFLFVIISLLLLIIPVSTVNASFGVFNNKDAQVVYTGVSYSKTDMVKLGSSNNVAVVSLSSGSHVNLTTYAVDVNGLISDSPLDQWTLDYPATSYSEVKIIHISSVVYLVVRYFPTASFRLVTLSISNSGVITKSIISGKNYTSSLSEGLAMSLLYVPYYDKIIIYTHASSGGSKRSALLIWGCSESGTLSATYDEEHVITIVGYTGNIILVDDDTIACAYSYDATFHYISIVTHNISGSGLLTGGHTWTLTQKPAYLPFIMHVHDDVYALAWNYGGYQLSTFNISDTGVIGSSFMDSETATVNTGGGYPGTLNAGTVSDTTTVLYSYGDSVSGGIIKLYNISSAGIISYVSNYGFWDYPVVSGYQYMVKLGSNFIIAFIISGVNQLRLDTFIIDGVAESGPASEDLICGVDVSFYNQKDSLPYSTPAKTRSSILKDKNVIEVFYGGPVSTTVFGVSLLISDTQYLYSSMSSNYDLMVNGVDIGSPVCMGVYGREDTYRLFWSCAELIENTGILFEFKNDVADSSGCYWNSLPVDTVSSSGWNFGKYSWGLFNGMYDGNDMILGVDTPLLFQVSFWSQEIIFENETSPYIDMITSSGLVFETFDTIPIYYTVSDYSYVNTIELWREGVEQTIQGFPSTVISGDFGSELSFIPFHNGSYQLRLMRNSLQQASFNFTVVDPSDIDFILSVYPNPCDFDTLVNIGFRFYPDDGADGFIGVSDLPETSNVSSFSEFWLLSANTSGNKSFYPQTEVYVSLWKKTGSSYIRMKIKHLKMNSMFDNTIDVSYKVIQLSEEYPSVTQHIYGTQAVQGFSTFIRLNNKFLQYVTDASFYSVYVIMSKGGSYNAELCMETVNGSQVLCSVNFTVSSPKAGGGGGDVFSREMKLLFGICCILVAVCCPLMISVKYHVAVPSFVYVVFMAFGIGLGTVLGFLELWLVFLFVVALVAGAVFTIFGHGGSGGGGGGGDSGTIRKGGILSRRGGKDYAGASRKADYGVSPKGSPGYLKGPGRRGY